MDNIDVKILFGSVEIKQFDVFENGRMVSYCYSIKRDRDGKEVSRTIPEPICSIGWDNGEPFLQKNYDEIMQR